MEATRKVLASGAIADVDAGGKAALVKCDWLVNIPTASLYPPEAEWYPDSPSDVYTEVPCGAIVRIHPDYPIEGEVCDCGHDRLPMHIRYAPGGPAFEEKMRWREDERLGLDRQ